MSRKWRFGRYLTDIEKLAYDIDGTWIYHLKFDFTQSMRSTVDGRPWKTWITSNRQRLNGLRKKASCLGSFWCVTENYAFLKYHGKQNRLLFNPADQVCSVCGQEGGYNACPAIKIWEFDDDSCHVKVFYNGYHICEERKPFKRTEEVNEKSSQVYRHKNIQRCNYWLFERRRTFLWKCIQYCSFLLETVKLYYAKKTMMKTSSMSIV